MNKKIMFFMSCLIIISLAYGAVYFGDCDGTICDCGSGFYIKENNCPTSCTCSPCGSGGWQTNWDECKDFGDGICGIGETRSNSPDCTPCIDDGYCSIHENHENCPDECADPIGISGDDDTCPLGGDGNCQEYENAVNCPADCTCKRDYCDARNAFLTCPDECADSESILTEIKNGEIVYPYEQHVFNSMKQEFTRHFLQNELSIYNKLLIQYKKTTGIEFALIQVKGVDNDYSTDNTMPDIDEFIITEINFGSQVENSGDNFNGLTFQIQNLCFKNGLELCGLNEKCIGTEKEYAGSLCCDGTCALHPCLVAGHDICGNGEHCSQTITIDEETSCCAVSCNNNICISLGCNACGFFETCSGTETVATSSVTCCNAPCQKRNPEQFVVIDAIALYDASYSSGWATQFTDPAHIEEVEVKCYSQGSEVANKGKKEQTSEGIKISFDPSKADLCRINIPFIESETRVPKDNNQIIITDFNGVIITDDEFGYLSSDDSKSRYINLENIDNSWELVQARMKLTSVNYNEYKRFEIKINNVLYATVEDVSDAMKITYATENVEVGYDSQTNEASTYLNIDKYILPGQINKIAVKDIENLGGSKIIISDLDIYYGKNPDYINDEIYVSTPMKWAFGMKGDLTVGNDACQLSNNLYDEQRACDSTTMSCGCIQVMRVKLPEMVCEQVRTSTLPLQRTINYYNIINKGVSGTNEITFNPPTLNPTTNLDASSDQNEIIIDYSSLGQTTYDYLWTITAFEISVTTYPFDAEIVASTHLNTDHYSSLLTGNELTPLMDDDGVYVTIPGSATPTGMVYTVRPETNCADGVDNDYDGSIDCNDADCNWEFCDIDKICCKGGCTNADNPKCDSAPPSDGNGDSQVK